MVKTIKNLWETKNEGFRDAVTAIWGAIVKVFTSPVDVIDGTSRLFPSAIDWIVTVARENVIDWVKENWPLLVKIIVAIFVPGGPILAAICALPR